MVAMKVLVPLLMVFIFAGCASVSFTPYEGRSIGNPTSPGTFVDRNYELPIYQGWPPQPYRILGSIAASDNDINYFENVDQAAVRVGLEVGADALIERNRNVRFGGTTGSAITRETNDGRNQFTTFSSDARWINEADYIAIKFE